ncbi:hypothetical protein BX600DRAFT_432176 [Xylariales sp. PMI_506]|nr:hypothetical protein BX600DRAFT_432176 [Xylariales sp. PMI_506]
MCHNATHDFGCGHSMEFVQTCKNKKECPGQRKVRPYDPGHCPQCIEDRSRMNMTQVLDGFGRPDKQASSIKLPVFGTEFAIPYEVGGGPTRPQAPVIDSVDGSINSDFIKLSIRDPAPGNGTTGDISRPAPMVGQPNPYITSFNWSQYRTPTTPFKATGRFVYEKSTTEDQAPSGTDATTAGEKQMSIAKPASPGPFKNAIRGRVLDKTDWHNDSLSINDDGSFQLGDAFQVPTKEAALAEAHPPAVSGAADTGAYSAGALPKQLPSLKRSNSFLAPLRYNEPPALHGFGDSLAIHMARIYNERQEAEEALALAAMNKSGSNDKTKAASTSVANSNVKSTAGDLPSVTNADANPANGTKSRIKNGDELFRRIKAAISAAQHEIMAKQKSHTNIGNVHAISTAGMKKNQPVSASGKGGVDTTLPAIKQSANVNSAMVKNIAKPDSHVTKRRLSPDSSMLEKKKKKVAVVDSQASSAVKASASDATGTTTAADNNHSASKTDAAKADATKLSGTKAAGIRASIEKTDAAKIKSLKAAAAKTFATRNIPIHTNKPSTPKGLLDRNGSRGEVPVATDLAGRTKRAAKGSLAEPTRITRGEDGTQIPAIKQEPGLHVHTPGQAMAAEPTTPAPVYYYHYHHHHQAQPAAPSTQGGGLFYGSPRPSPGHQVGVAASLPLPLPLPHGFCFGQPAPASQPYMVTTMHCVYYGTGAPAVGGAPVAGAGGLSFGNAAPSAASAGSGAVVGERYPVHDPQAPGSSFGHY